DCRVARSVRLVIDAYDRGVDWRETRNIVVEDSADLGWFQAPANIAFTVLGLLYGEGDFKKSMILAINCGDDTDCTGATLGSLMGIMYGTSIIPPDWQRYIGDDIITISIIRGFGLFPRTCQELTDCVMNLLPVTTRTDNMTLMHRGGHGFSVDAQENNFEGVAAADFMGRAFVERMFNRSRYSFTTENVFAQALVEFDREPVIAAGGSLSGRVSVRLLRMCEQKRFSLHWHLPEGWTVSGGMSLHVNAMHSPLREHAAAAFTLTAGDSVAGNNRLILEITCAGRPTPVLVPITILG
ncbi:MAG: ADP-ribosylglycohydrolase family protein, partial [Clostridiales bacterium]|nr:ADP-ribosylglycohydrolase family protein [Clostridiales bacterium]